MKLQPCPFCGGTARTGFASALAVEVVCDSCGSRTRPFYLPDRRHKGWSMGDYWVDMRRQAARAWNKRAGLRPKIGRVK